MKTAKIELYRSEQGDWYWRLRSTNSRIMADGAEGYAVKKNALKAIERVRKAFLGAEVRIVPTDPPKLIPLVTEFPKLGKRTHRMGEE